MKIKLTIETEDLRALHTILSVGSEYTLYDYKIHDFEVVGSKPHSKAVELDGANQRICPVHMRPYLHSCPDCEDGY